MLGYSGEQNRPVLAIKEFEVWGFGGRLEIINMQACGKSQTMMRHRKRVPGNLRAYDGVPDPV